MSILRGDSASPLSKENLMWSISKIERPVFKALFPGLNETRLPECPTTFEGTEPEED